MNKEEINIALDRALESDFSDTAPCTVPMVIPEEVQLPSNNKEEQDTVKKTLLNTSAKLSAVLDYYVNNLEELSNNTGTLIKSSPVSDICSLAREIGLLNDKLYKYATPTKTDSDKKIDKLTQNNIIINKDKEENTQQPFSLETLDNLIRSGTIK